MKSDLVANNPRSKV